MTARLRSACVQLGLRVHVRIVSRIVRARADVVDCNQSVSHIFIDDYGRNVVLTQRQCAVLYVYVQDSQPRLSLD